MFEIVPYHGYSALYRCLPFRSGGILSGLFHSLLSGQQNTQHLSEHTMFPTSYSRGPQCNAAHLLTQMMFINVQCSVSVILL